ncbi:transposase [Elysia marginata]|uniref:Transposase n=1 Tax=Elysia marginata TaxID=1093978 RepID=A0AAV4JAM6_9GAST|nr:transposase [Elysia marginata]
MNKDIPWLMDRLHVLLTGDSSQDDWQHSFQLCDPRKIFTAELCDACYQDVTVMRCGENIHVISKDEVAIGKLMLFLHDGTCECKEAPKTLAGFCLLDFIAASGSMTALRESIVYFQKYLPLTIDKYHDRSDECKCFKTASFGNQCLHSDCESESTHLPIDLTGRKTNELTRNPYLYAEEKMTTSNESLPTNNPKFLQCSVKRHGGYRYLLSPNCGGGYGERKQFPDEDTTFLEDNNLKQEHDYHNSSGPQYDSTGSYNHDLSRKALEPRSTGKCEQSQNVRPGEEPCLVALEEQTNTSFVQPSPTCFQSSKPDTCLESACRNSPNGDMQLEKEGHNKSTYCQVPMYAEIECPLACCFRCSDIDYLRQHIDQASLLSMSIQALFYNHGSMIVCARALRATKVSQLVRMSGSLPATAALLYLYFLSIEDTEAFSEVALDDLFLLHERTLPLEVSQLCQLAWTNHPLSDSFSRARHTTLQIAICHNCELAQFPDRQFYGKTARVKFRRGYHENAGLFKCIENRSCPCSASMYKQTQMVMAEVAASASGNFNMVRALTTPWLSAQAFASSKQGIQHNKGCLRNSKKVNSKILSSYHKLYPQGEFILQQDGATSHTSRATRKFLIDQGVDLIAKDDWPPESPDLNPVDYAISDSLAEVYIRQPIPFPVNELKAKIKEN